MMLSEKILVVFLFFFIILNLDRVYQRLEKVEQKLIGKEVKMLEERIDISELSDEEYNKYAYDTETFLFYAHEGLLRFGGSFATNLGRLLASADRENKLKIIRTWPNELTEHAKLFILWAKKHRPDLLIPKENNDNEST